MTLLALLAAAVFIAWTGEAHAQFWRDCRGPTWLAATVASYHFERPNDYRERHAGIGFEHACGAWRGVGGVIPENSKDDTSLYVGAAWMPLAWRELRGGLFGGLFTGYSKPILPAAALVGAWEGRRYGVNLLWFPPYDEQKGLAVLQLKRKF